MGESIFDGLVAVVQYRRKDGDEWKTMAAYDSREIADKYAEDCSGPTIPWEYRVLDVPSKGVSHD